MLILDELKKNDLQLRLLAGALVAGFFILLAGLWWVQVVSAHEYQRHLETQSYRTVRLPAMRGKILDRHGRVLAENRACYNLDLYLGDLRKPVNDAYKALFRQAHKRQLQAIAAREQELGRRLTKNERRKFLFTAEQIRRFQAEANYRVASAVVAQVGRRLDEPLSLDPVRFERNYRQRLALPYTVVADATPEQVARFEEQKSGLPGVDVAVQAIRTYPLGTMAGHVIGYLRRDDRSRPGEDAYFFYRLPDYRGVVGIEGGFDKELRGRAGVESVLVNNMGYRQSETILDPPQPGENVVLTIDLNIQRAAEESLLAHQGPDARAAIVVMNVHSGDVLAMVSSPAINPGYYVGDMPAGEFKKETAYLNNPKLRPQINRATQENYSPGSIFKPIVALAALEAGLNPNAIVNNPGYVMVGRRRIGDLAPPGQYNLRRAIIHSCNTYFITIGLRAGIENVIRMAEKFHLGERTGLPTRQETSGILPTLSQVRSRSWHNGDSANICFGQGKIAVTPLQMAVAYAAIANGGTVLWPRLVERIEPQDPASGQAVTNYPSGLVRDELGVKPHYLKILHAAMLAETEDPEGTGHAAYVGPQMRICGKTGTAQVMDTHNHEIGRTTWFASFAPYERPRYAVVVMVENGEYGGSTCGPIAHDIYEAIVKEENSAAAKTLAAK